MRRTGPNADWGPFIDKGHAFTISVNGNLDFNQIAPAVQACVAGMGFGMFLAYQVAPYVLQNQLQIVLQPFEAPARPLSVVYPHARLLPARTRAFVAWMREELSGFQVL
jgi:DNA-binding transcriptional LysR family regulator